MSKRAGSATSGVRPDSAATGMRAAAEPSQPIDGIPVSRPNGASQRSSASQQPPRPPSWASVIATTVRLWFQRKVRHDAEPGLPGSTAAPGRGAPGASRGTLREAPRRRAAIFGLAIVVFAAGALTIALAEHQGGGQAAGGAGQARTVTSPAAVRAAQASRNAAAAWVAAQVSHDVIVGCDPAMCTQLQGRGFPAGDLLPITAQSTDPMGSQVVVATATLRSQFGSRLADIYAPAVIASFGTGASQVVVRVEAPDGSQAYLVTQRADLLARQGAGRQLVRNRLLHVSGTSRRALLAGRVDPRLLITLAALTAQGHTVYISRFGDSGPGTGAGSPLRMMRISALEAGKHGRHKDAYLRAVLSFLRAQRAPYLASTAVLRPSAGTTVIQVQFGAPSPLGLLGAHAAS